VVERPITPSFVWGFELGTFSYIIWSVICAFAEDCGLGLLCSVAGAREDRIGALRSFLLEEREPCTNEAHCSGLKTGDGPRCDVTLKWSG
jgi:hypothetical protein